MSEDGFDTPEEAARGDIPARYARTLATAIAPDERAAVVVLGTNEEPLLYPYEVVCYRENGRWFEGAGSNLIGIGWTSTSWDEEGSNLGVHRLVGEAPEGAVEIIVGYSGQEHRVPVSAEGWFIFAAWDVPDDVFDQEEPQDLRYVQADGSEMPVPEDEHREIRGRMRELMRGRGDGVSLGEGGEIIEFLPDDDA